MTTEHADERIKRHRQRELFDGVAKDGLHEVGLEQKTYLTMAQVLG